MLKSIKIHNFKTFLNAEFHFARRHLILGKNNSGKTNLVIALSFLSRAACSENLEWAASGIPGGLEDLCNRKLRSREIELSCRCDSVFDGDECGFEYELTLSIEGAASFGSASRSAVSVRNERLTFHTAGVGDLILLENDGRESTLTHEEQAVEGMTPHHPQTLSPKNATMLSKLYELESNRRAIHFRRYMRNWSYFSFSPLAMRQGAISNSQDGLGVLDSYGERLAYAIYHLKNFDEHRYRRLIEHAQMLEPALEAINFVPVPNQVPFPFVHLSDAPKTGWVGLSDGTLRGLALAYCIEAASAASPPEGETAPLVMIEEPENGIFPGQLRRFYDLFEEWAPAAQFVFTSHSPYFIDMFDDNRDCVTILRKAADRSEAVLATATATAEHEELTLSMEYASELFE